MNTNTVIKLTMVSITVDGRRKTWFIKLPYINGKAVMSESTLNKLLREIGCYSRGHTFSIG